MLNFICMLFVSIFSFGAPATSQPKNFCFLPCSDSQAEIWSKFEKSQFSTLGNPTLYSGQCFHRSSNYNSEHPHHAVFFISEVAGGVHMSGRLSFFAPTNPFSTWTVEEALRELPKHHEEKYRLQLLEKSALLDLSSQQTAIRYWVRHSLDGRSLYLVGVWGRSHTMFCDLTAHP